MRRVSGRQRLEKGIRKTEVKKGGQGDRGQRRESGRQRSEKGVRETEVKKGSQGDRG